MSAEPSKVSRWWLLLLLLLLWWWWGRRRTAKATTDTSTPAPPDRADGVGSSLTMQGYRLGDTSDAALDHVSAETIAMLNSNRYYSLQNGAYMDIGLYQAWLNSRSNGANTADVKQQIGAVLTGQPYGPAAAADAAASANSLAASLVHTSG
jgi:hypothetical protein